MTAPLFPWDEEWRAPIDRARVTGILPATEDALVDAIERLMDWHIKPDAHGRGNALEMVQMLRYAGFLRGYAVGDGILEPADTHSWGDIRELLLAAKVAFSVEEGATNQRRPIIEHLAEFLSMRRYGSLRP